MRYWSMSGNYNPMSGSYEGYTLYFHSSFNIGCSYNFYGRSIRPVQSSAE